MNEVELFATLLAQRGRVRSVEYSSLSAYEDLIKAGLIKDAGIVSSIICDDCDQPHDAKVVFEGSQYGCYCPENGFVPKARSDLIATQPDLSAFVSQISGYLACTRRKSAPLIKDTWRIGAIDSPAGGVLVYVHPTLLDAQDVIDLQTALMGEIKSQFGVVLTSQGNLAVPPYVTVQLQDVLSLDPNSGRLLVTGNLPAIAGVPEKRSGGRPNEYKKPLGEIFALRASQGRGLQGRNEEAKALQAEFSAEFPDVKPPSLPMVKKYVSEFRSGS